MLVLLLMCGAAVATWFLAGTIKFGLLGQRLRAMWFPAILISSGFTISMPFWLEGAGLEGSNEVGKQKVVVVFEGNRIVDVARGIAICHPWKTCANAVTSMEITATVNHTVDKKRAHQLQYRLTVAITDFQLFFDTSGVRDIREVLPKPLPAEVSLVPTAYQNQEALSRAVQVDLYEFHNVHAEELAGFYNPQSPEQVSRLETLLKNYLQPRLAKKGIRMEKFLGFEVE